MPGFVHRYPNYQTMTEVFVCDCGAYRQEVSMESLVRASEPRDVVQAAVDLLGKRMTVDGHACGPRQPSTVPWSDAGSSPMADLKKAAGQIAKNAAPAFAQIGRDLNASMGRIRFLPDAEWWSPRDMGQVLEERIRFRRRLSRG